MLLPQESGPFAGHRDRDAPSFPRRLLAAGVCAAALALAPVLSGPAQAATSIGVTAAVNPQAEGTPPDAATRVLHVGIDMLANERVTTSASGQAQLLFLDGSAMSIGPNSEVLLDRFVYDPEADTGDLAVTVGRGVFRFVGGRISKRQPVQIGTGTATIGIRGGIATITVDDQGGVQSGFLFGEQMTVTSEGVTQSTSLPGSGIDVPPGMPPEPPRILTTREIAATMSSFQGPPPPAAPPGDGESGSGGEGGGDPDSAMGESGVAGMASDGADAGGAPAAPPPPAAAGQGSGDVAAPDATQRQRSAVSNLAALQREADAVYQIEQEEEAAEEIIADDDTEVVVVVPPTPEPAPPEPLPQNADGRLFRAPVYAGFNSATLAVNLLPGNTPFLSRVTVTGNRLAVTTTTGESYDFPWSATGTEQVVSSPSSTGPYASFTGRMLVAPDASFWRVGGVDQGANAEASGRFVLFGGTPTSLAQIPTSGTVALAMGGRLGPLPFFGGQVAFGSAVAGISLSPLFLRYGPAITTAQRDTGQLPPIGYQGAVAIQGQGAAQTSFMAGSILTLVEEGAAGSGRVAVSGLLVGSERASADQAPIRYSSWVGSADAGERSAIFGDTGQYMVLDSSQLGQSPSGGGIDRQSAAMLSAGPAIGDNSSTDLILLAQPAAATPSGLLQRRDSRIMRGFTGGVGSLRTAGGAIGSFTFTNSKAGIAPGDVLVQTIAGGNSVTVDMRIQKTGGGDVRTLFLGGANSATGIAPSSAFIDNARYAARHSPARISQFDDGQPVAFQNLIMLTGQSIDPTQLELDGQPCTCAYLDWGFWSGRLADSDGSEERYHLATWVAGELAELAQMPLSGSASYTGQIIGSVNSSAGTHVAGSQMGVSWNFGQRSGQFNVSSFDSAAYAGQLGSIDGRQVTGSAVNSALGRTMTVDGAFYRGGSDPAAAMGGNFAIDSQAQSYSAAGTWALDRQN